MSERPDARLPAKGSAMIFIALGWTFAVLSLRVLPIVFTPFAVLMGFLAMRSGARRHGFWIIIVSLIFLALSLSLVLLMNVWYSMHPEITRPHS